MFIHVDEIYHFLNINLDTSRQFTDFLFLCENKLNMGRKKTPQHGYIYSDLGLWNSKKIKTTKIKK